MEKSFETLDNKFEVMITIIMEHFRKVDDRLNEFEKDIIALEKNIEELKNATKISSE